MALLKIKVGDDFIEVPAIKGSDGKDFTILGQYATIEDLEIAHPTGTVGDYWAVGDANYSDLYIWDSVTNAWVDIGQIGVNLNASYVFITDVGTFFTSDNVEGALQEIGETLNDKQNTLVSGTNIKTINGSSILLSGDLLLATKSTEVSATLSSASWVGASAPFTYDLTVSGVTTTSNQEILPSTSITLTELEALQGANIIDAGQSTNTISLKAFGTKPTVDIPIRVILRGDK